MKKTFIIAASTILALTVNCKKNTEGNKVLKQENGYSDSLTVDSTNTSGSNEVNNDSQEVTERYVAVDGSSALVTFRNNDKENTISIRSNNKTISAPQKEAWAKGGVYGNFDINIVAKNDSITITQGDNIIYLKKARGQ